MTDQQVVQIVTEYFQAKRALVLKPTPLETALFIEFHFDLTVPDSDINENLGTPLDVIALIHRLTLAGGAG